TSPTAARRSVSCWRAAARATKPRPRATIAWPVQDGGRRGKRRIQCGGQRTRYGMSPDPFGNLDPRSVARALGGEVVARDSILCPGPGHSRRDRSLSIRINPAAPEGFLVHSFAGDDPLACREYARDALGLSASSEERHRQARRQPSRSFAIAPDGDDDLNRSA